MRSQALEVRDGLMLRGEHQRKVAAIHSESPPQAQGATGAGAAQGVITCDALQ
jgi:hypothetical protein